MIRRVYIKNSVFLSENFNEIDLQDKNIDGIGKMCIITLGKLLDQSEDAEKNVPIFFGSGYSCLNSLHEFNKVCEKSGALMVNPSLFPNTVLNSPSCRAGIHFSITQPIYNISNGVESGLDALGLAYMYIANGEIDHAIVCAAEEASDISFKIDNKEFIQSCAAIYLSSQITDTEILEYRKDYDKSILPDDNKKQCYGSVDALYRIYYFLKVEHKKNKINIEIIRNAYKTTIQLQFNGGNNDRDTKI